MAKYTEKESIEIANKVWDKLLAFSGYGFNKSHAAAYTIMSYWSQWFKANYPLEFWTTALQFSKENEVPYRLAELKKAMGDKIEVRPPDVNFSDENFTCDDEHQRIFYSLAKIKGCGPVAVHHIVETRKEGGRFFSLEEFCSRVPSKVNKSVIRSLIIAGAFDLVEGIDMPRQRKEILEHYLVDIRNDKMEEEYDGNDSNSNSFWILEQKKLTGFGEVDYETMIKDSIKVKRIAKLYVNDTQFLDSKENTEATIAGKLIYYKERKIKTGTMCSIQIDCNNTIIPVLLWPDAYEKIDTPIEDLKGLTVAINGRIRRDKFKKEKTLYSDARTKVYTVAMSK